MKIHTIALYRKINSPQTLRPRVVPLHSGDREKILHMCSCSEANPQNVPLYLASTSFHLLTRSLRKVNIICYERFKVVLFYSHRQQKIDVGGMNILPPSGQWHRSELHSFHAG